VQCVDYPEHSIWEFMPGLDLTGPGCGVSESPYLRICGHLALPQLLCYDLTQIMGDNAYLALKLLGSLVAAVAGVVGTLSDLRVVKDGHGVLSKGGYAVLACLILGTFVSMTTDYHKELSDRSATQAQLDKLSTLVDETGVTNSKLQGANKDLETQVTKSQKISDQLSDTEKKVDAASNRVLDPFSSDIEVHVAIWIPDQPFIQSYLRRIREQRKSPGETVEISSDQKLFPVLKFPDDEEDFNYDPELQLAILARFGMIEVEFPSYRQEGMPRVRFYAHCGAKDKDSAHLVRKWIVPINSGFIRREGSTLVNAGNGIMLFCETSQVEWQPGPPEIRSFQDLSGKDFKVEVDLLEAENWAGADLRNEMIYAPKERYGYDEFRLNYEIVNLTAGTARGRGFSSDRFRKKPCDPEFPLVPCFYGRASTM